MPTPKHPKPADTQEAQSARFIEAPRQIGADKSDSPRPSTKTSCPLVAS